jgi:sugar-specific transcriptional regulator TrmB
MKVPIGDSSRTKPVASLVKIVVLPKFQIPTVDQLKIMFPHNSVVYDGTRTTMSEEDLKILTEFGLSAIQAKTYVAVLRLGRSKASHICSVVGLTRSETYRILGELSVRGLVQRCAGSPSTFAASPPCEAVSLLIDRVAKRLALMEEKRPRLIECLESWMPERSFEASTQRFDLIMGGGAVLRRALQLITKVEHDYAKVSSRFGIRRLAGEGAWGKDFSRAIIAAKNRGVRIRIISEADPNFKPTRVLSRCAEIRELKDVSFYFDIVDLREMVIGPFLADEDATERSSRQADLWTNNSNFILGMHNLFERLWESAMEDVPATGGCRSK